MPPFNEIYEANNLETIGTNIIFFSIFVELTGM